MSNGDHSCHIHDKNLKIIRDEFSDVQSSCIFLALTDPTLTTDLIGLTLTTDLIGPTLTTDLTDPTLTTSP